MEIKLRQVYRRKRSINPKIDMLGELFLVVDYANHYETNVFLKKLGVILVKSINHLDCPPYYFTSTEFESYFEEYTNKTDWSAPDLEELAELNANKKLTPLEIEGIYGDMLVLHTGVLNECDIRVITKFTSATKFSPGG